MHDIYGPSTIGNIETIDKVWTAEYGTGTIKVNIQKNSGTTTPTYNKDGDVRLYPKNTITIKSDRLIKKMSFHISRQGKKRYCEVVSYIGAITTQSKDDVELIWTGNNKEVKFTVDPNEKKAQYGTQEGPGQFDFDYVIITFGEEDTSSKTPVFSMQSCDVRKGTKIEIDCPTSDASIFYTTDGETPTTASQLYDGAITINKTTTIKAIAYNGTDKSFIAVATYTVLTEISSIDNLLKLKKIRDSFMMVN
ncbi:MAG: chitobiase/beta-hexosaminidase C-terminal domain-containing protein [Clostridium sp.]|nr:chitobiase/beta-hexosaminidase C-terminal domain-containing protein [Clostridium sp.]